MIPVSNKQGTSAMTINHQRKRVAMLCPPRRKLGRFITLAPAGIPGIAVRVDPGIPILAV